eukprot:TRINITY_DN714_c0_g4_i1.p1 TRINITY_DN714_c0_g4~~TRINITY_DN714_c0_g4_i1.p1  ORF type:complete len:495 (-),score=119.99 TRINITY_DN714_c0_g4_i1:143-1627(-)
MGGAASVPLYMGYQEAKNNISNEQEILIRNSFNELSSKGEPKNRVTKESYDLNYDNIYHGTKLYFEEDDDTELIAPPVLRQNMFKAFFNEFESNQQQLDVKQYLSTIVSLQYGSSSIKNSYVFRLFDMNNDKIISKIEFCTVLEILATYAFDCFKLDLLLYHTDRVMKPRDQEIQTRKNMINGIADNLLKNNNKGFDFNVFEQWLQYYSQITFFVEYLLHKSYDKEYKYPDLLKSIELPNPQIQFGKSDILSFNLGVQLKLLLPQPFSDMHLVKLFSTVDHGFSLSTLLFGVSKKHRLCSDQNLLIIKDTHGNIFGVFTSDKWHKVYHKQFYGSNESFLFKLSEEDPEGANRYCYKDSEPCNIMYADDDILGVGGSMNNFGLSIDHELYMGTSNFCKTFDSPSLTSEEKFVCANVELYSFLEPVQTEYFLDSHFGKRYSHDNTYTRKKSNNNNEEEDDEYERQSILDHGGNKDQTYVLGLLSGHGYSEKLGIER